MASIISKDAISSAVAELDRALYMHELWAEEIYTALVCHLHPDDRDLRPDAHRQCRFGQWYYSVGDTALARHRGFAEVEVEHKRMHEYAASLLAAVAKGEPVSPQAHERFVSAMKRTRLEIQTLKQELEVSLYNIDPLTGVPGRVEMLGKIREQQEYVTRGVHSCVVAMLDVDRFKSVNDTYGHPTGDNVLVEICRHAQANLRPYDMMFRYGGEEFVLCLPDRDLAPGRDVCERLRGALAELEHRGNDGKPFAVTVSIGVAALEAGASVETAIDRADQALLVAKKSGRDKVVVWEELTVAA